MNRLRLATCLSPLLLLGLAAACGDNGDSDDGTATGGGGGAPATGGTNAGTGGTTPTTGGSNPGTGGTGGGTDGNPIAGTENYDCTAPSGDVPELEFGLVAGGFSGRPVLVTHAPNDTERLFVVEQDGLIKIISNIEDGTVLEDEFIDLSDKLTRDGNEEGLLGLAFHPDYATNGLFYVHYSAADDLDDESEQGDVTIEEYKVSDDPNIADAESGRLVLHVPHPGANNHNGGTISFGSDGFLYIAIGDGGTGGANAPDLTKLLGKVLRINPLESGDDRYTIPDGNLVDENDAAEPEIWDFGLRNPFRMNFDACTGHLYIGDVGEVTWEEINVELAGEGHKNYGWPTMEGLVCRSNGCDQTGLTLPVTAFDRLAGTSVAGGSVYRGSEIPALRGTYFYADTGNARIWSFSFDGEDITDPVNLTEDLPVGQFTSIQNGGDGELYVTDFSNGGRVLKLRVLE